MRFRFSKLLMNNNFFLRQSAYVLTSFFLLSSFAVHSYAVDLSNDQNWSLESSSYNFSISDCKDLFKEDTIELTWELSSDPVNDADFSIKRGTCSSGDLGDVNDSCFLVESQSTISGTIITWEGSPEEFTGLTEETCSDSTDESTNFYLFYDLDTSDAENEILKEILTINIYASRPDAPENQEFTSGETQIELTWDEVDNVDNYVVYSSTNRADFDVLPENWGGSPDRTDGGATTKTITGLTVNTTYYVAVVSEDSHENRSEFPELLEITTVPAVDFWEAYVESGGAEDPNGCTHSSTRRTHTPWWIALATLTVLFNRRKI